jgi:hypothetical protein
MQWTWAVRRDATVTFCFATNREPGKCGSGEMKKGGMFIEALCKLQCLTLLRALVDDL